MSRRADYGDAESAAVGTLYAWHHRRTNRHSWGREARAADMLTGATMLLRYGDGAPAHVPVYWRWEWCADSVTVINDD
jgi:hypothetical protein